MTSYGATLALVSSAIGASVAVARVSVRGRRALLAAWGALALGYFPWLTVVELTHGLWTLEEGLPLHLCDVSSLLVGVVALGAQRDDTLPSALERPAELAFYLCTGGGLAGLLVPQVTPRDPTFVPFVLWHATLVATPCLLVVHGMRPTFAGVGRSLAVLFALSFVVALVNLGIDANYMFLRRSPAGADALLLTPPLHVLTLLAVGALVMLVTWLPFGIARRTIDARAYASTDAGSPRP